MRSILLLIIHDVLLISLMVVCVLSHPSFQRQDVHTGPDPSFDWDSFGFSLNGVETEFIWLDQVEVDLKSAEDNPFSVSPDECLMPSRPIALHPSSTVLNYGQSLFEGLKAFRRKDGSIAVFRPEMNADRMTSGANRFFLPTVPRDVFINAIDFVVRANCKFIPPVGKGALYLRPLLFGSAKGLGVKPSEEATFCIYSSPVGNYFKGNLKCISLQAVKGYARAARGGSGNIKAGGNYAPPFALQRKVRERGYDEALFLDATEGEYIEEAGASNFFALLKDKKTLVTPSLENGTILPGVTRASLIELAKAELGLTVVERPLSVRELKDDVDECFCCGTGASVTPVGRISYLSNPSGESSDDDFVVIFGDGVAPGTITKKLYNILIGIQSGDCEDAALLEKYEKWIHIVDR